jgi:ankyrin repeat protein
MIRFGGRVSGLDLNRVCFLCVLFLGLGATGCEPVDPGGNPDQALEAGDLETFRALVDSDPSLIGRQDEDGMTPLHHAAREGQAGVVELLLERGADVGIRDAEDRTPLHHAANLGDAEATRLLLAHGADVMAREFRGRTPLFIACNWGENPEVVRLLLDAGADVNDRTPGRGEEILFSTLFYGMPEIISLLLEAGARLPEDDQSISRAVYVSASNGLEQVFEVAVQMAEGRAISWWEDVPFHAAARGGSVSIGESLLARDGDIHRANLYGVTPLHIPAEHGRREFVDFLTEGGVALDETSRSGLTALHFAQNHGHDSVAARLLALGATEGPRAFPVLRGPYLGEPEPAPGDGPRRFAPGIVSGHAFDSEHSPAVFSADGSEVYWTERFRGPILFMKQDNGVWTSPEPVSFGSEFGDGEPIFTPDGQRIYFLSMRPLEPGGDSGKENVWYVEREGTEWGDPNPVSSAVNAYDHHWLISLTSEETLYFASVREGGHGGQDIYRAVYVDGEHQEPENLGSVINTAGGEHTPFIAPDESYLIFASTGHPGGGEGLFTLFISYRNSDGSWLPPISLDGEMDSFHDPLCPAVTPDGRFIFFIGEGDIWWMDAGFIEGFRPA